MNRSKFKAVTILRGVKDLFSKKSRWTQHVFAETKNGCSTSETADDAACFCLAGGINHIAGSVNPIPQKKLAEQFVVEAIKAEGFRVKDDMHPVSSITSWNDKSKRTIQQVRRVLKTAIKLAEAA